MRDALNIWGSSLELQGFTANYNKSDRIFESKVGSIMEFKSYKDSQDAKSGKRDYLFVNEANGIPFEVYNELALRTRKQIYIDYNPNAEFWVHEHLMGKPNVKFIRSWHEHNPFLSQQMRDKIEGLKEIDEDLWRVYARGLTGKIEGLIFRNHNVITEIPKDAEFISAGMDFGFTNDPTTLIEVYRYDGELYVNELLFSTGLTNQDIGNRLTELGFDKRKQIVADSAEPKSIEELRRMGFNVQPAQKGQDSIRASIDILKRFVINITSNSTNLKKEFMNYKWSEKDKTQPVDAFNHCFTGETLITTIKGYKRLDEIKVGDLVLTSKGYKRVIKVWDNGLKQVNNYSMQLDTFNVSLWSTYNHLVKTTEEWTQISKLQSGQTVYQHKYLTGKSIDYIQKKDISQGAQKECTQKSGSFTMVKFLKHITFIIKTKTLGIIGLIILNLLKLIDTFLNTVEKGLNPIRSGLNYFIQKVLRKQKNGTSQKKGLNGIKNKEKELGLIDNIKLSLANVAVKNTKLDTQVNLNSVITTASLKHLEIGESKVCRVYDLYVEDCHEYFANGVLVHNCIDAIRYVALNRLANRNTGRYNLA